MLAAADGLDEIDGESVTRAMEGLPGNAVGKSNDIVDGTPELLSCILGDAEEGNGVIGVADGLPVTIVERSLGNAVGAIFVGTSRSSLAVRSESISEGSSVVDGALWNCSTIC